ncbi:MAG: GTP cyclohydrolase I FolE [Candidatus Omnitrophica bacterium]|nr:GTP cyclohydrolase I FolE [Candidatus Omnitrophota bacterium]MCM8802199.1 GTP cyclohydrolase I FolE [Candidatus Omnitrophota bacterium]
MKMDIMKIEKGMELIIEALGENINKKKLKDTPKRVAKMYAEIFSGIDVDPEKVLGKVFKEDYNELVLIKDINFYSICEHHFLPFFGKAHVAYLPDGNNVVGISKIARLIDVLSKRPQLQERMTNQIVDIIMNVLTPQGAMAIVEAEHMCMIMRGIKKPGTKIVTSAMRGIFLRDLRTRTEALNLISPSRSI